MAEDVIASFEALQAEMAAINEALADPQLYARDPKTFAARSKRLGAAQAELDAGQGLHTREGTGNIARPQDDRR